MKQFFLKSTALTFAVFIVEIILYTTILKSYFLIVLPFAVLLFYLVTNLVHIYLLKIAGKSGSGFVSKYMAVSFLKMFFYLAVAIVYVVFNRENAKPFFVNFLLLYVVYSSFEVVEFLKVVRQQKQ
jgi:hypothetical protein